MESTHNQTQVTYNSTVQEYDILFILDFCSRYAIRECGADNTILTAVCSLAVIMPVWIWFATITISITHPEIYALLAKYTIGILSIVQIVLMVAMNEGPPTEGCGPSRAFPSIQTSLSAYGLTLFAFYDTTFKQQSTVWRIMAVMQLVLVVFSTLHLGFNSPPSVYAGVAVGACIATVLHLSLVECSQSSINKLIVDVERLLGTVTVNTVVGANRHDSDEEASKPPPIRQKNKPMAMLASSMPLSMGYSVNNNHNSTIK